MGALRLRLQKYDNTIRSICGVALLIASLHAKTHSRAFIDRAAGLHLRLVRIKEAVQAAADVVRSAGERRTPFGGSRLHCRLTA